jgi:hypothetical protein
MAALIDASPSAGVRGPRSLEPGQLHFLRIAATCQAVLARLEEAISSEQARALCRREACA